MFERANLLVGIYKTNDCTQSVTIKTDMYKDKMAGALTEIQNNI